MNRVTLDERLRAVADLVRQDAYFADIGTDHAYLPVFLLKENRIAAAYASDVAEGPLATAAANIAENGEEGRVTLRLADGLQGLFSAFPRVSDIAICGMGGELIARLLSAEPQIKDPAIHLILQPMSRPHALRTYLAENGFAILREELVRAQGRIYTCILASYTGRCERLTYTEAEIGRYFIVSGACPLYSAYIGEKLRVAEKKRKGMARGECDTSELDAYISDLRMLLRRR